MKLAHVAGLLLVLGLASCDAESLPARSYALLDLGLPEPGVERAGLRADLYVPAQEPGADAPPLFVYLLGGVWEMPDSNYARSSAIGDALRRHGIAVAMLRFALADGYGFERCANDVVLAVDALRARAGALGFDRNRVVIGGHGPGGLLAARLGLDGRVRAAGVVTLRAIFDLTREELFGHPRERFYVWASGDSAQARREASPATYVSANAPPFLILNGAEDFVAYAQRARSFARALEEAGGAPVQAFLVPERDGDSLLNLSGEGNAVTSLVAEFIRGDPVPQDIEGPWAVKQIWGLDPPLSSEPFWDGLVPVSDYAVDERFRSMLGRIFENQMYELKAWPGQTYHALDLLDYLDARGDEIGSGDHLVITNMRGERTFLTRATLERARARLVIGLDGERNLYRLFASYRMGRLYSWVDSEAELLPKMIRPVGAFLFFPDERTAPPLQGNFADFGLDPDSFAWHEEDPLAPVNELPESTRNVLLGPSGCLYCHAFRGAGARSHHVTAEHGVPHGAYALALEEYPPEVLRDFLFDQDRVAEMFGVNPLALDADAAEDLIARVRAERERGAPEIVLGPRAPFN